MKKKFIICFAALLFILPLNCLAGAEGQQAVPFVRDEAGLLTQEQLSEREQQAEATAGRYGCATYILTVEDFRELGLGDDNRARLFHDIVVLHVHGQLYPLHRG